MMLVPRAESASCARRWPILCPSQRPRMAENTSTTRYSGAAHCASRASSDRAHALTDPSSVKALASTEASTTITRQQPWPAQDGVALGLADALEAEGAHIRNLGVAYPRFVLAHPAHFAVMFRADLLDPNDQTLRAARERAFARLLGGSTDVPAGRSRDDTALAGWSLMHGLASLWLDGTLAGSRLAAGRNAEQLAAQLAGLRSSDGSDGFALWELNLTPCEVIRS